MCPFGCNEEDTLRHLLKCNKLVQEHVVVTDSMEYEDVFSTDLEKQLKVTRLFSTLIDRRNSKLIDLASGHELVTRS